MDPGAYRRAMSHFATGVTVVTTVTPNGPTAMTANSFTSVSLSPLLVLVSVEKVARWHEAVRSGGVYAVSVLAAGQQRLARTFAERGRVQTTEDFLRFPTRPGPATGCLLFEGALTTLECRVAGLHDAGDHTLVMGEVLDIAEPHPGSSPLLFFQGGYQELFQA